MISHDPRHRGRRYLQCTTMGWFPVLLCTLSTSSMTSVMVARLVHTPSGDQLVMWNWVTCCIWVLCVFCADQSQIIIRYMLQKHLYTIMRFSQCTNSRQNTHRYGELHNTHRYGELNTHIYGELHDTNRYGELHNTHRYGELNTHIYGELHNTHRYGELHNTHRYGELHNTHRYGELHNTHRYGELHNTHRYGELPNTHRYDDLPNA